MSFDIVIPTWNNLAFLKLAIWSIKRYSSFDHGIYVHVNEGSDGTLEWLKDQDIDYTYFEKNKGVCEAINKAAALGDNDIITFFNDDMVALPGWDEEIVGFINANNLEKYMLCSTPIEPKGSNPNCIIQDYGSTPYDFGLDKLLSDIEILRNKKPNMRSTWPPFFVPRSLWNEVGGLSLEYEPGNGSEIDLCKKMYDIGCRYFVGIGKSLIYHFQSKTIGRILVNDGRKTFKQIHGIDMDNFINNVIQRGETL